MSRLKSHGKAQDEILFQAENRGLRPLGFTFVF